MRTMVAAVQMTSTEDKPSNLATAARLVEEAARRGAQLVALPELFTCLGRPEAIVREAEPVPGPASHAMARLAARLQITLLAGSMAERVSGSDRVYNTSLLFGPDGQQLARYRKIHLFDVDLPGLVTFHESQFVAVGDCIQVSDTTAGRLGQAVCYDLRFPELFRCLADQQAEIIAVPSAFAMATGRDHWEVLLRARAIENQAFVVAPNQFGRHGNELITYGRSMIVDPWGTPLAIASDGESMAVAEIDFDRLRDIRRRLPALRHRRTLPEAPVARPESESDR